MAASVMLLAALWQAIPEPGEETSPEYRAFIDFYPMTRSESDLIIQVGFGKAPLALPSLLSRFDWMLGHYSCKWMEELLPDPTFQAAARQKGGTTDHRRSASPQTIFAAPQALHGILETAARDFHPDHADRILVLGGADDLLSFSFGHTAQERTQTVARLRKHFKAVFYEAKDVEVDGVKAMPIGLLEMYMRRGRATALAAAAAAARTDDHAKERNLLAAFSLLGFSEASPPNYSDPGIQARHMACLQSRLAARNWAGTAEGREAGVEVRDIGQHEYFGELARYRFALSPLGAGVQSPKMIEALLVLTVPVVERVPALEDLVRFGFPLVVVDTWANISAHMLQNRWHLLAPRLGSFRKHCLTTEAYWQIFTGQLQLCE